MKFCAQIAALKEQLRDTQMELDAAQSSRDEEAAKVRRLRRRGEGEERCIPDSTTPERVVSFAAAAAGSPSPRGRLRRCLCSLAP